MDDQQLVADLLRVLGEEGNLDHLDAYGGALFALDLQDAFAELRKKGWKFTKKEKST